MNKKNVLQVCRLTPAWGIDLFKEITRSFQDSEFEITTVFLSNQEGFEKYSGFEDYFGKLVFFGIDRHKWNWRLKAVRKLHALFKQFEFDVVVTHHYKPAVLVELATRIRDVPNRFCFHHNIGNIERLGRKCFVKHFMAKRWTFLAVSESVKKGLVDSEAGISESQVVTIHNAIDLEKFTNQLMPKSEARKVLGIPKGAFVFGNVGRLARPKGQANLIRAFASIAPRFPHTRLAIIGKGYLEKELRALIKVEEREGYIVINSKIASDAARYISAFDVFVMPSVEEAFGLVLLEAMGCRLPIIATRVGGIPDAVGDTAIFVPYNDINSLSMALENIYLMDGQERKKYAEKAYTRLLTHFTLDYFHHSLCKLITQCDFPS